MTASASSEQVLLEFLVSIALWFFLSMIINRWMFERTTTDEQRIFVMPVAAGVNVALTAFVFSYWKLFAPGEFALPGALVGVFSGAAVGLLFSNRNANPRREDRADRLS